MSPALYRASLVDLVPPGAQSNIKAALGDAGEALRRWLCGLVIAMVLVGTLYVLDTLGKRVEIMSRPAKRSRAKAGLT